MLYLSSLNLFSLNEDEKADKHIPYNLPPYALKTTTGIAICYGKQTVYMHFH